MQPENFVSAFVSGFVWLYGAQHEAAEVHGRIPNATWEIYGNNAFKKQGENISQVRGQVKYDLLGNIHK